MLFNLQSILRHQHALLSFLYHLAQISQKSARDEVPSWNVASKEFSKFRSIPKSFITSSSNSQDSVKQLYDREKKKLNTHCHSLATRVQSQSTTISSVTWSRNDFPTSSKLISKYKNNK